MTYADCSMTASLDHILVIPEAIGMVIPCMWELKRWG